MRKHIAIIVNNARSLVNFHGALILEFIAHNCEVSVLVPRDTSQKDFELVESLGTVCYLVSLKPTSKNLITELRSLREIRRLLRFLKPDYMFAYTIKPVVYGLLSSFKTDISKCFVLISGLGTSFLPTSFKSYFLYRIVRVLYYLSLKRACKVIFLNTDDKKLFLDYGFVTEAQARQVNGTGVDIEYYSNTSFPKNKSLTFLMISRFIRDKGIYEYVSSAKNIREKYPKVRFLLVGFIDENPSAISTSELKEWEDLGIIECLGQLDDVRPAIEKCNVFVLPSYREGTSKSVLEAMSMGRPVITTNAPGCRETVNHGVNGYIIETKSSTHLVKAMEKFIEQPDLVVKMGKESRRLVEEKYDVNKVNREILNILEVN